MVSEVDLKQARFNMIEQQVRPWEVLDGRVLSLLDEVPRELFVPEAYRNLAYADIGIPLSGKGRRGQEMMHPNVEARMLQALQVKRTDSVLEIGTGSGYQAAILSELTPHVYTIEIVEPLGKRAIALFKERGYHTIRAKIGDGYKGWPQYAPFDAVIVTCAPDHIPQPLVDQLKDGGKIVIPVGDQGWAQELLLVTKNEDGTLQRKSMMPVRFVPLTREKE